MSYAPGAPEQLTPDSPGLWWRTRMVSSKGDGKWEWFVVEVFEWQDGQGLRTGSGPIAGLLPCIKWGGRAMHPDIDPHPEPR